MKEPIFLIEKGNDSWVDGHGTRYWTYRLNPKRFKLKRHEVATITHYSNDFTNSKKYNVLLIQGFRHVWYSTDSFKEAFKTLKSLIK